MPVLLDHVQIAPSFVCKFKDIPYFFLLPYSGLQVLCCGAWSIWGWVCVGWDKMIYSFMYSFPAWHAQLVENVIFSICIVDFFIENQATYIYVFISNPLISMFVLCQYHFLCFNYYCSSEAKLKIWDGDNASGFFLLFMIFFSYLGSFVFPHNV